MSNKISYNELFNKKKINNEGVFIPFIVAGDPDYDTSLEIVKTLVNNGVDALEIGFPFSDPVADGKTVQDANFRALNGNMNIKKSMKFLEDIRKFTDIPIGLLLYYNLVYKYGVDEFYKKLSSIGVNGVLIADLPPEEADPVIESSKKYDINQIFIAAQSTTNERLEKLTKIASGFIYVVSVMGVTGARRNVENNTTTMIERLHNHTDTPLCVGFGISKPDHVKEVLEAVANGTIVGSAIINIIKDNLDDKNKMLDSIGTYVKQLKKATI